MKPLAISYVPPVGKGHPHAFLANLKRFPATAMPLLLFSDVPDQHTHFGFEMFKMRASPEVAQAEGGPMWPAVSNMAFLSACILANRRGFTHILYLEEDCRVVEGWDSRTWAEYVAAEKPNAVGGSIVIYHSHAMHGRAVKDANALKEKNWAKNVPVAEYGKPTSEQPHKPSVFPNGALGIYPLNVMDRIFHFTQGGTVAAAQSIAAYDHYLGWKLYDDHGDSVFDHVVQLNSVYSTYKDQVVTTEQRQVWLTDRKFVAIHPVKTDWPGPDILESRLEWQGNAPTQSMAATASSALPTPETTTYETVNSVTAGTEGRSGEQQPQADAPSLRVDILIVSFAPDVWWLDMCLKSITKFAKGFGGIHVAYPSSDAAAFTELATRYMIHWHSYQDAPPPLGHLMHDVIKCEADLFCPEADAICHVDSDCFFREPVSPSDYLIDGKPVLLIESFEHLKTAHPGRYHWKGCVDAALKIDCSHESMCRHPAVHYRGLYPLMRERIEQIHGKSFREYVLGCKPDRPTGFTEFPTMGAYAMNSRYFKTKYAFIDVTGNNTKRPHDKLLQFWSRQSPELEQTIWIEGEMHKVVPSDVIKGVLG